jgi:hypothetical protein
VDTMVMLMVLRECTVAFCQLGHFREKGVLTVQHSLFYFRYDAVKLLF